MTTLSTRSAFTGPESFRIDGWLVRLTYDAARANRYSAELTDPFGRTFPLGVHWPKEQSAREDAVAEIERRRGQDGK